MMVINLKCIIILLTSLLASKIMAQDERIINFESRSNVRDTTSFVLLEVSSNSDVFSITRVEGEKEIRFHININPQNSVEIQCLNDKFEIFSTDIGKKIQLFNTTHQINDLIISERKIIILFSSNSIDFSVRKIMINRKRKIIGVEFKKNSLFYNYIAYW